MWAQWLALACRQRGKATVWLVAMLAVAGVGQTVAALWHPPWGGLEILLCGAHIRQAILHGQPWRLLTYSVLHADWLHLAVNAATLSVVGRPVEAAFGPARLLLIYWGSVLAGGVAALGYAQPWWSVGASAGVLGVLGALVGLGIKLVPRLGPKLRWQMIGVPALALAVLVAISGPQTDRLAHVGGALGGIWLGAALHPQFMPRSANTAIRQRSAAWVRWAAFAWCLTAAVAVAVAVLHVAVPVPVAKIAVDRLAFDGVEIRAPAQLRRGNWLRHNGQCQGEMADPAWLLRTRRIACFELPIEGVLLLGRRDQLFTLDREDFAAFDRANRTGSWVQRQQDTLVAPVGRDWVWVIAAPQPLLSAYKAALAGVLPVAGSAEVALPAAPTPTLP